MKLPLSDLIGILSLIIAALSLLISFRLKWITKPFKWISKLYNSCELVDFDLKQVRSSRTYFIPNSVTINGETIEGDSIRFLRKNFLFNKHLNESKFFFLVGVTGIGKTTYLFNLFLEINKYTRWKKAPTILLGKIKGESTWKRINYFISKGEDKETILLLDALDEFSLDKTTFKLIDYLTAFEKFWEEKKYLLSGFKKVIISVRQQIYEGEFNSGKKNIQLSLFDENIHDNPIHKIYLNKFSTKQSYEYLRLRYKDKDLQKKMIDFFDFLLYKIDEYDYVNLFTTPFCLNFLEDIYYGYQKESILRLSDLEIYHTIAERWIEREFVTKRLKDSNISSKAIEKICEKIAFKMYKNQKDELTSAELLEIETSIENLFDFRKGLTDRSLLKKERLVNYTHSGFKFVHEVYTFAHKAFFDYFLFCYEIHRPAEQEEIDFTYYVTAADLYIGHLWSIRDDREFTPEKINIHISEWIDFLKSFSENSSIGSMLLCNSNNILERQKQYWKPSIYQKEFIIYSDEFWDLKLNIFKHEYIEAIRYLESQIQGLIIENLPIEDVKLKCLEGIKIRWLLIVKNCPNITGKFLGYIHQSPVLQSIWLERIDMGDEELLLIPESENYKSIFIKNTKIMGRGLSAFSLSYGTINHISLIENNVQDEQLEILSSFDPRFLFIKGEQSLHGGFLNFIKGFRNLIGLHLEDLRIDWNKSLGLKLSCIPYINLINMDVTDSNISQILIQNEYYYNLDLSFNKQLTSTVFFESCKRLKSLKIEGCGFDNDALNRLKKVIPEVHY